MPKCDFNKVAKQSKAKQQTLLQLYWNRTLAWEFTCKFAAYFQNTFSYEHLWMTASEGLYLFYSLQYQNFVRL